MMVDIGVAPGVERGQLVKDEPGVCLAPGENSTTGRRPATGASSWLWVTGSCIRPGGTCKLFRK
jgi:hypothetical protein